MKKFPFRFKWQLAALNTLSAGICFIPHVALAQDANADMASRPVKSLGVVTVTSGQPTSLPSQIPTTMEGITKEQIETSINATDSEDALRYFPSLLVRKRYIGDYNHAVLSSRASGTGNSARSAVYADGVLLSNYLGNGATYAPRWGLVTPEEIERVDVMYGPFSAAYPGNSVGAIVDYRTRMPQKFEANVQLNTSSQQFNIYETNKTYSGYQGSVSLGNKSGDWSFWVNANHLDSQGHPMVFAIKPRETTTTGKVVTGGSEALTTENLPAWILGTSTQYHTLQDHAKVKAAYDVTPTLRASYTLGYWQNDSKGTADSYLKDASGNPYYGYKDQKVKIGGIDYKMSGTEFGMSKDDWAHVLHGFSLKSNTQGIFDWEVAASLYDFQKSISRATATRTVATESIAQNTTSTEATISNMDGTGWANVALKGTWRPQGSQGEHILDFGVGQDAYRLRALSNKLTPNVGDWLSSPAGAMSSDLGGRTDMVNAYVQDAWSFAPLWKTVLGVRAETWQASGGYIKTSTKSATYAKRNESFLSPKAALSYQMQSNLVLKASAGRAFRMPTVSELYGSTTAAAASSGEVFLNEPNLKPERSWTTELSAEKDFGTGMLRVTYFEEDVRDAIFSQVKVDSLNTGVTTKRVTNVDRMGTKGLEIYGMGMDVLVKGLDLSGSMTYADSRIKANSGYDVNGAGTKFDTVGKLQPRVPEWRASALGVYRFSEAMSASVGARYSGPQYSTLGNYDVNGFTYTGVSKFFTVDTKLLYKIDRQWTASVGIDNLNNYKYWNFHLYPGRTFLAEVKWSH